MPCHAWQFLSNRNQSDDQDLEHESITPSNIKRNIFAALRVLKTESQGAVRAVHRLDRPVEANCENLSFKVLDGQFSNVKARMRAEPIAAERQGIQRRLLDLAAVFHVRQSLLRTRLRYSSA
jgi:hypothetical protein